ncbi:hypothetical protein RRG08_012678 [Elysia crispata]|uniref:Uncharacterized protein n=1 Tax=Elysia crispata TaxID=231223 RepID=A0AAE1D294_9GAST|nr:hypothetical protein RRG08_012678 [Elysia crispata]
MKDGTRHERSLRPATVKGIGAPSRIFQRNAIKIQIKRKISRTGESDPHAEESVVNNLQGRGSSSGNYFRCNGEGDSNPQGRSPCDKVQLKSRKRSLTITTRNSLVEEFVKSFKMIEPRLSLCDSLKNKPYITTRTSQSWPTAPASLPELITVFAPKVRGHRVATGVPKRQDSCVQKSPSGVEQLERIVSNAKGDIRRYNSKWKQIKARAFLSM